MLCNGRWRYRSPVPVHLTRLHWQLGMSCADAVCFEGSYNDPHQYEMCVCACSWVQCSRVVDSCIFSVCVYVYMFLYLVHHWDLNVVFSLVPESGLTWKHVLRCIINLFECWLLGEKLWKCWILLPFLVFSLPRMSSSEKLETLADFTTRYVLAVSSTIVLSL